MEIVILLTMLLISLLLGGLFFQGGRICPINKNQINDSVSIQCNLLKAHIHWAVKLILLVSDLLNTVTFLHHQKAAQAALIQTQIHKIEG